MLSLNRLNTLKYIYAKIKRLHALRERASNDQQKVINIELDILYQARLTAVKKGA